MIVAKEKKEENIVEYLLYMFQIENSLRAFEFNETRINKEMVSHYQQPEEKMKEIRDWYHHLIRMMKEEHLEKRGHLQFLKNTMNDLYALHKQLLHTPEENSYAGIFHHAVPDLNILQKKINHAESHDIEIALEGVYAYLLLNMHKDKISKETKEAVQRITRWLFLLAGKYKEMEQGGREW